MPIYLKTDLMGILDFDKVIFHISGDYPVSTVCDSPFEQDESYAIQCSTQNTFLPTAEPVGL